MRTASKWKRVGLGLGGACLGLGLATGAWAGAIISNGTVQLGVDTLGNLNIPGPASAAGTGYVGLRYVPTNYEATAPGCLCEGWGVSNGTASGYANNSTGTAGLSSVSFASDATTAKSVVSAAGGIFEVTHDYKPSAATSNLYEVTVSVKNTSGSAQNVFYRRVMDWDVEPTAFSEFVTLKGWPATALLHTSDDGFSSADPLSSFDGISAPDNANFEDNGPGDHGALFDFQFGSLADGDTKTFTTYYGAAATEAAAMAALGAVGAEVYSLGQTSTDPNTGTPNTFIFAFKGVGGTAVPPTGAVPEPGTMLLLGSGLLGLAGVSRRMRK